MEGQRTQMATRRGLVQLGGTWAATGGSALALSACGAPQGGTTANTGNPQSLPPATIRFHHRGGVIPAQEPSLYAEQLPAFQAKFPNIKVAEEGFTGEDYYTKITVLSAGGTLGDVMWTSVGGGGIYNLVAQKMLLPLDTLIAREKFDLNQYYKNTIEGLKREGKLYGLPFKAHPGVGPLFYNETEFTRTGAGIPDKTWTLDRFLDAAKRVTNASQGVWGYNPAVTQKSILT